VRILIDVHPGSTQGNPRVSIFHDTQGYNVPVKAEGARRYVAEVAVPLDYDVPQTLPMAAVEKETGARS
jgi:hypothetical protein